MPQEFPCLALTLRPRGGITPKEIEATDKYLNEISDDYGIVQEIVDGDPSTAHIHCVCFLKKPSTVNNAFGETRKFARRLLPYLNLSNSLWKYAVCAKGVYSDDWCAKYMTKSEDVKIIKNLTFDVDKRRTYYVDKVTKKQVVCHYLHLEKIWFDTHPDRPPRDIEELSNCLATAMYRDRVLRPIDSPAVMKRTVRCLYLYIMRSTKYDYHSKIDLHDTEFF